MTLNSTENHQNVRYENIAKTRKVAENANKLDQNSFVKQISC